MLHVLHHSITFNDYIQGTVQSHLYKLMETIIVPIIKDKNGLVSYKDNYCPIAITSVV